MGFLKSLFGEKCVYCGEVKDDLTEHPVSGLKVCGGCMPSYNERLEKLSTITISTLTPNRKFKELTPVSIIGFNEYYSAAFNEATELLKAEALNIDADGVVGVQYQFRSALSGSGESATRIIEIMAFGTAIKYE